MFLLNVVVRNLETFPPNNCNWCHQTSMFLVYVVAYSAKMLHRFLTRSSRLEKRSRRIAIVVMRILRFTTDPVKTAL